MIFRSSKAVQATAFDPREWSVSHVPDANTVATITYPAGGEKVRHVLRSFDAILTALAAASEATVVVNIRDGATGTGTILRSFRLVVIPGGASGLALSGLNIVGSFNTAMTIEFTEAAGANTFESVGMSGYDIRQS